MKYEEYLKDTRVRIALIRVIRKVHNVYSIYDFSEQIKLEPRDVVTCKICKTEMPDDHRQAHRENHMRLILSRLDTLSAEHRGKVLAAITTAALEGINKHPPTP